MDRHTRLDTQGWTHKAGNTSLRKSGKRKTGQALLPSKPSIGGLRGDRRW
jgi:hypothetical protein